MGSERDTRVYVAVAQNHRNRRDGHSYHLPMHHPMMGIIYNNMSIFPIAGGYCLVYRHTLRMYEGRTMYEVLHKALQDIYR